VTCIPPPLLCSKRIEGQILEAPHFRLQKTQVHERRAAVVLPESVVHPGTADPEDRYTAAVAAADLDRLELAAADKPEGPEE
jgi:hypothetical protein